MRTGAVIDRKRAELCTNGDVFEASALFQHLASGALVSKEFSQPQTGLHGLIPPPLSPPNTCNKNPVKCERIQTQLHDLCVNLRRRHAWRAPLPTLNTWKGILRFLFIFSKQNFSFVIVPTVKKVTQTRETHFIPCTTRLPWPPNTSDKQQMHKHTQLQVGAKQSK